MDVAGKLRAEHRQSIARIEDAAQGHDVFKRSRRRELNGQSAALPLVFAETFPSPSGFGAPCDPGSARQVLDPAGIAGEQALLHLLRIVPRLLDHQGAADPGPQRFQRPARDTAAMLVVGCIVNQERLDRLEEQPRRVGEPQRLAVAVPEAAPQLGQDHLGPGRIVAAQRGLFEFGNELRSRAGLHVPEQAAKLIDAWLALDGHSGTTRAKSHP